ncbi:MarR family winged helix-turn-helix transcriptional regulator [Microbacterium oxydans]|uniref:MarR family protein n=1 Tax=Microbacterium oxydans TaxID=82380 RepID=A0A0F0L6P1_9MICO|nr:MarR family transcriptional regulator [Microbacterium oxydans]KJL28808.1 MarR family protein [Microbacterium oxydans]
MPRRVDHDADPAQLAFSATLRSSTMTSLMTLVQVWTSEDFQASMAVRAGVRIQSRDIPALLLLGLNGPMRPSELALALRVSGGTVSKIADRLVLGGFAARVAVATDARASRIALTRDGVAAATALFDEGERILAGLLDDWKPEELHSFSTMLGRVVDRVSAGPPE